MFYFFQFQAAKSKTTRAKASTMPEMGLNLSRVSTVSVSQVAEATVSMAKMMVRRLFFTSSDSSFFDAMTVSSKFIFSLNSSKCWRMASCVAQK